MAFEVRWEMLGKETRWDSIKNVVRVDKTTQDFILYEKLNQLKRHLTSAHIHDFALITIQVGEPIREMCLSITSDSDYLGIKAAGMFIQRGFYEHCSISEGREEYGRRNFRVKDCCQLLRTDKYSLIVFHDYPCSPGHANNCIL